MTRSYRFDLRFVVALITLMLFARAGILRAAEPVRFSEHLLAENLGYVFGVAAADLDGDGDLDLTSPDIRNKSHSTLFWYQNDGKGSFKRLVIYKDEPGWFERHAIGDLNGDGTLDVAIINNLYGQVVWFANSGKPAAGLWRRFVISTDCPKAYGVTLADFDRDGDLDAATSGYVSHLVTWYENPGTNGLDKEWARHVIDNKMHESRTIDAGDFNRDGKIDLLATAVGTLPANVPESDHKSQVVWYENSGQPSEQGWTKHLISNELPAAIHGQSIDVDADGDLDVVMAHGMRIETDPKVDRHQVVWYENIGKAKELPT